MLKSNVFFYLLCYVRSWWTDGRNMPASMILCFLVAGLTESTLIAQNQDTISVRWEMITSNLQKPVSIDVTGLETMFVVEEGNNRFLLFDLKGNRIDSTGNQGFGDYQFDSPRDIDGGNGLKIYVSDYNNRRIQIYDRRLQYLTTIKPREGQRFFDFYKPTELAVTNRSELYFYDEANKTIIKYNFQGELDVTFSARLERVTLPPVDLNTLDDRLLVADVKKGVIHEFSSNGQYLKFWGRFTDLRGMDVTRKWIWVLTAEHVHRFNLRGVNEKIISLGSVTNALDIAAYNQSIFILTENDIWKAVAATN